MQKIKGFRKLIYICLLFGFIFDSNAAVVSDNDGSAFVSKAEFDALKNNFSTQIDQYNDSINEKIDGDIASYLAGLQITKTMNRDIINALNYKNKVVFQTSNDHLWYKYSPLQIIVDGESFCAGTSGSWDVNGPAYFMKWQTFTAEPATKGNKIFINEPVLRDDNTTYCANMVGYYDQCYDICRTRYIKIAAGTWNDVTVNYVRNATKFIFFNSQALTGQEDGNFIPNCMWAHCNGNPGDCGLNVFGFTTGTAQREYKKDEENIYYFTVNNFDYDCFSNFDSSHTYGYTGTQPLKTNLTDAEATAKKLNWFHKQVTNSGTSFKWVSTGVNDYNILTGTEYGAIKAVWNPYIQNVGGVKSLNYNFSYENRVDNNHIPNYMDNIATRNGLSCDFVLPIVGFENAKIKNWNSVFYKQFDIIASKSEVTTNTLINTKTGNKHLSVCAGMPFVEYKKNESVRYTFDFEDKTKDYYVWFKTAPFKGDIGNNGLPDNDSDCLDNITGLQKATGSNHAYKVPLGVGTFETPMFEEDGVLYIKCCKESYNPATAKMAVLNLENKKQATILKLD